LKLLLGKYERSYLGRRRLTQSRVDDEGGPDYTYETYRYKRKPSMANPFERQVNVFTFPFTFPPPIRRSHPQFSTQQFCIPRRSRGWFGVKAAHIRPKVAATRGSALSAQSCCQADGGEQHGERGLGD
jgi:hypothetical protein